MLKTSIDELGLEKCFVDCFEQLPGAVTSVDCDSPDALFLAFKRVLRDPEAHKETGVVFFWAVEEPYPVTSEARVRVSYIEMTSGTLASRWPDSKIKLLTTDGEGYTSPAGIGDLRRWADESSNWSYYSQLILRHGQLRVWWASASRLNRAAGGGVEYSPLKWEGHLLRRFQAVNKCLPAKNRKHSGRLLNVGYAGVA